MDRFFCEQQTIYIYTNSNRLDAWLQQIFHYALFNGYNFHERQLLLNKILVVVVEQIIAVLNTK